MPDDGYEYVVGLKDEMTPKVERARDALGRFAKGLAASGDAVVRAEAGYSAFFGKLGGVWGVQAEKAAAQVEKVAHAANKAHGGAHTLASGISFAVRGFDDLSRGGKYAANGLLDVGKAFTRLGPLLAGAAIVGGTAAMAKYALEVSEAREQTIAALDIFQGEGKGEGTFRALDTLAASVHAPAEKVGAVAKELLELGLTDKTQLLHTVRAVEDLQRVGLDSGARKLESIVERSLAAGHLALGKGGAGAARALAGTGISEAGLAAQLGIAPKQLEAELKAGKITVEEGIAALDRAIIDGKVGALATKKFTVSDAFTDLHNSVRKLFQESDDSPITESLRKLSQGFADGTDGARLLSDVVDGIFKGISTAIDFVGDLGSAFKNAAESTLDAWDKVDDFIAGVGKSGEEKERIASQRRLTNAKRHLSESIEAQSRAFEEAKNLAQSGASEKEIQDFARRRGISVDVLKPTGRLVPKGTREAIDVERTTGGVGTFTVDRETGHFANPAAALHDAQRAGTIGASGRHAVNIDEIEDLGAAAGKALHDGAAGPRGLDAHSPSRKMFDLGVDSAAGLVDGYERGRIEIPEAALAGKSITVHVHPNAFHIEAHSADASELQMLLESQIADVFERVALEMGG